MANDKTKLLEEKSIHLWFSGSPLALCSIKLELNITEGAIFATAKFMNVQPEPLRTVVTDIVCYDAVRQKVGVVQNCVYRDLDIKRNEVFGMKIPFRVDFPQTRNVEFLIKSVTTMSGETWFNTDNCHFNRSLEQNGIFNVLGDLHRQFIDNCASIDVDQTKLILQPVFDDVHWMCACGTLNWNDEQRCFCCGVERDWLRHNVNRDVLSVQAQYNEAEAKKVRDEAAARELRDKESQTEEFKKRKESIYNEARHREGKYRRKRFAVVTIVLIILAACAFGAVFFGYPYAKYLVANEQLSKGNYDKAIDKFSALNGYLDSDEKIKECLYNKALDYYMNGDLDKAADQFRDLDDYKDSFNMFCEVTKRKADINYEAGDYLQAAQLYKEIGASGQTKLAELKVKLYDDAVELKANRAIKKTYKAYDYFSFLGDYKDSAEMANACLYDLADYEMQQLNYSGALSKYRMLKGYKNVDTILHKYQFLADILSAAGNDDSPAVWNAVDTECPICGNKVKYVFEFYNDGKFHFSILCDNEPKPQEMEGNFKVENDVIYEMVVKDGKKSWSEMSLITKISSAGSEMEGKNTKLIMSNPFDSSKRIHAYGNIISDDTLSFAN